MPIRGRPGPAGLRPRAGPVPALQGKTALARWRAGAFDDIEDALLL